MCLQLAVGPLPAGQPHCAEMIFKSEPRCIISL